jgi:hypothetical protein
VFVVNFLKGGLFDARRNQQDFVSKNAEWLDQEISLHIKATAKTSETE